MGWNTLPVLDLLKGFVKEISIYLYNLYNLSQLVANWKKSQKWEFRHSIKKPQTSGDGVTTELNTKVKYDLVSEEIKPFSN